MSVFVGAESVVMNALIDAYEKQNKQELTFEEVVCYGKTVARVYRKKTGEDAVLLLSRADQVSMMESYPQYLDMDAYVKHRVFRLREDVSVEEVKELFRWLLDIELLDAVLSSESISALCE